MADQSTAAVNKMLFSVVASFEGKINFDQVTKDIEVANAEAARKRFKRFLEKEKIDLLIKGNDVASMRGAGETAVPSAATDPKTPKKAPAAKKGPKTSQCTVKAKDGANAEEEGTASNKKIKTPKSAATNVEKKRKAAELDPDDEPSLNFNGDVKETAEVGVIQEA